MQSLQERLRAGYLSDKTLNLSPTGARASCPPSVRQHAQNLRFHSTFTLLTQTHPPAAPAGKMPALQGCHCVKSSWVLLRAALNGFYGQGRLLFYALRLKHGTFGKGFDSRQVLRFTN